MLDWLEVEAVVKTFCYKKIEELLLSYFLVEEDGRDEGRGTRDERRRMKKRKKKKEIII